MKQIKQGMVLAAGLGTRMQPLTNDRPKALVEVAGRTLLDWALDRFEVSGVTDVVVNVHHMADKITDHLATRKSPKITISDERDKLLETGGGVVKALPHFKGEPFFVQNADAMWLEGVEHACTRLASFWDGKTMDALLLLAPTVQTSGYTGSGDFDMDAHGKLLRRDERGVAAFVFTGLQLVHPRLFDHPPADKFSTNVLFNRALEAERLYGLRHDGFWMHVGTPDAIVEAENALRYL